ncbi:cellobiose phosphorylase [Vallitalea okinawensis]|uniref:cellobiose phosphorylase n=1 Tax=Vallitalea okinawensis TaxID=2078660 RepID=UPI000CFB6CFE|nr:cellobiose phosphorylase [Vallitalea okinawensis]
MKKDFLSKDFEYYIKNYDREKAFSSFLPGIAGKKGIPIWAFYVNRGQGICSFGIKDKDNPITEFFPANAAYQYNHVNGFRSFIKVDNSFYEAFAPIHGSDENIKRTMKIEMNQLTIEEINYHHAIKYCVTYFVLPNEDFGSLVRKIEVENLKNEERTIEIIDGHPAILPAGIKNEEYKAVGNLFRSWMEVYNLENNIAFYKLRASTTDEAEVTTINEGHFFLTFSDDQQPIRPVVDVELIFGNDTGLTYPMKFQERSVSEIEEEVQVTANKVPGAFTLLSKVLQPLDTIRINSFIGHVSDIEIINKKALDLCKNDYIDSKQREAKALVEKLTNQVDTQTNNVLFDAYIKQNFLDNVLRGGYPEILKSHNEDFVYHIYSRKHGDPEREYNAFHIAPEFYSQGNGNFRDVNQNRRNDVFIEPKAGKTNIKTFMSLIQMDGYNPLVVKGTKFELNLEVLEEIIDKYIMTNKKAIKAILQKKFTPGELLSYIRWHGVNLRDDENVFLSEVLANANQCIEASFGEGYWSDHFTYNMDLIDNYLKVFPDCEKELVFCDRNYKFFQSPVYVLPRSEKYVLTNEGKVRQYGSVMIEEETSVDINETRWLKTASGDVYTTNLYTKLLVLAVNKFLLLDPFGMGIEMEANKPGWNDAMNGLPGLLSSGLSETFELVRIVKYLDLVCKNYKEVTIAIPEEIFNVIHLIIKPLQKNNAMQMMNMDYWEASAQIREDFRREIRYSISGKEKVVKLTELTQLFNEMQRKLMRGIHEAQILGNGLYHTYYTYEATEFDVLKDQDGKAILSHYGLPKVNVKSFCQKPINYFLEGPARAMKVIEENTAKEIYDRLKETDLYDRKLKMYKTSGTLNDESFEIGRIKAFTPGWLERESIFLHMTYKYMLALLKVGLYDEFYEEIKTNLICNLDPSVYGRSILENSSFIASSVNPNPKLHGQGFVARLSGSTAEMLSMWVIMMTGQKVFGVEKEQLYLELAPILSGDMFNEEGILKYTFLGHTQVTYINKKRKNTFGEKGVKVHTIELDNSIMIEGNRIMGQLAVSIRNGEVNQIKAYME